MLAIAFTVLYKAARNWLNYQDEKDRREREHEALAEARLRQLAEYYLRLHPEVGRENSDSVLAEMRQLYEAMEAASGRGRKGSNMDEFSLICIMAVILHAQSEESAGHCNHDARLSWAVSEAVEIVARVKDLREGDTIHINVLPFKRWPKPAAAEAQ